MAKKLFPYLKNLKKIKCNRGRLKSPVAIVIFGFVEVVFGALLFIKPILTALGSAVSLPAELAGLEFSMYSNLSVTWICNTILFFFSIAYAIIAHKVKIDYKVEKRAKKAAKAA